MKDRSITESVLLTQENIGDIRKRGKHANVIINVGMAKAYDRVDWRFLMKVMEKLGLDSLLVDRI